MTLSNLHNTTRKVEIRQLTSCQKTRTYYIMNIYWKCMQMFWTLGLKGCTASTKHMNRGVRYPIWFNSIFEFCQKIIHSIFDSILLYPRFNSKKLKENCAVSNQKIIQFNSQGVIDTGRIRKVLKNYLRFSSKMAKINSKYDSFIHFTIQSNSKD